LAQDQALTVSTDAAGLGTITVDEASSVEYYGECQTSSPGYAATLLNSQIVISTAPTWITIQQINSSNSAESTSFHFEITNGCTSNWSGTLNEYTCQVQDGADQVQRGNVAKRNVSPRN